MSTLTVIFWISIDLSWLNNPGQMPLIYNKCCWCHDSISIAAPGLVPAKMLDYGTGNIVIMLACNGINATVLPTNMAVKGKIFKYIYTVGQNHAYATTSFVCLACSTDNSFCHTCLDSDTYMCLTVWCASIMKTIWQLFSFCKPYFHINTNYSYGALQQC